jgi:hypothetical protein
MNEGEVRRAKLIEWNIELARQVEEIATGGRWMRAPEWERSLGFFISSVELSAYPDLGFGIDIDDGSKLFIAFGGHLENVCIPQLERLLSETQNLTLLNNSGRLLVSGKAS